MNNAITVSSISLIMGIFGIFGVVFGVYLYFRNPQIKTDQETTKLRDDVENLRKQILEIKETHLRSVENDIKTLTAAVSQLEKTVVKLTTIIDERIPKGFPALTPPGV